MENNFLKEHASYGVLNLSRVHSSGNIVFNGYNANTSDYITIEISKANAYEFYGEKKFRSIELPYIKLRLTYSQLMEALLDTNCGGVPVTIERLREITMPPPPNTNHVGMYEDYYDKVLKGNDDLLEDILQTSNELLIKGKASKKDLQDLNQKIKVYRSWHNSNLIHAGKQFKEYVTKTISNMKIEIKNYLSFEKLRQIKKDIEINKELK